MSAVETVLDKLIQTEEERRQFHRQTVIMKLLAARCGASLRILRRRYSPSPSYGGFSRLHPPIASDGLFANKVQTPGMADSIHGVS